MGLQYRSPTDYKAKFVIYLNQYDGDKEARSILNVHKIIFFNGRSVSQSCKP